MAECKPVHDCNLVTAVRQQELFGDECQTRPKKVFRVNPVHIKYKLKEFVEELRELQSWPWTKEQVELLHSRTWPYFYRKLDDPIEAEKWRALIEAEATRLTAATTWPE